LFILLLTKLLQEYVGGKKSFQTSVNPKPASLKGKRRKGLTFFPETMQKYRINCAVVFYV